LSPTRKAKPAPPLEEGGPPPFVDDVPTPTLATSDAPTFESAFAELQRVVEQLESGGLDLDRVVELFDRGMAVAHTCEHLIDSAELRVTRLTAETASPLSDA
jgi:exodeoxyribonuclease VII small subunit